MWPAEVKILKYRSSERTLSKTHGRNFSNQEKLRRTLSLAHPTTWGRQENIPPPNNDKFWEYNAKLVEFAKRNNLEMPEYKYDNDTHCTLSIGDLKRTKTYDKLTNEYRQFWNGIEEVWQTFKSLDDTDKKQNDIVFIKKILDKYCLHDQQEIIDTVVKSINNKRVRESA